MPLEAGARAFYTAAMTRSILTPFLLVAVLTGCGESRPAAGGNVTMRDMEVVDGTANDSMTDLDNATQDGTLLSNTQSLPPSGTRGAPAENSANAATAQTETDTPGGNMGTAQ